MATRIGQVLTVLASVLALVVSGYAVSTSRSLAAEVVELRGVVETQRESPLGGALGGLVQRAVGTARKAPPVRTGKATAGKARGGKGGKQPAGARRKARSGKRPR